MKSTELIFEEVLCPTETAIAYGAGVVFTPTVGAVSLMVGDIKRSLSGFKGKTIRILEPASGAGSLIVATIHCLEMIGIKPNRVEIVSVELEKAFLKQQKEFIRKNHSSWINSIKFYNSDFLFGYDSNEAFDYVIMNPPWIGYRGIDRKTRDQVKTEFGLTGQFDLLDPFVLRAFELTKDKGRLYLYLPDKVLSSHQPSNSIDIIGCKSKIEKQVDLNPSFFDGVQHESVFMVVSKNLKKTGQKNNVVKMSSSENLTDFFDLFRGLEISGRDRNVLTDKKSMAYDSLRNFITGQDMTSDGSLTNSGMYLSNSFPEGKIKKHFDYTGPAILVRKTGSPVNICYVDKLPYTSQVVFILRPKEGLSLSRKDLKAVAEFLRSPRGQSQLSASSRKLNRSVFPYITIGDVKSVRLPKNLIRNHPLKRAA